MPWGEGECHRIHVEILDVGSNESDNALSDLVPHDRRRIILCPGLSLIPPRHKRLARQIITSGVRHRVTIFPARSREQSGHGCKFSVAPSQV